MSHKEDQEQLAQLTDSLMLSWVRDGIPVFDNEGVEVRKRAINAGELQGILKRLGQCNLTVPNVGENHLTKTRDILATIGVTDEPNDLPPLSMDDDAATA